MISAFHLPRAAALLCVLAGCATAATDPSDNAFVPGTARLDRRIQLVDPATLRSSAAKTLDTDHRIGPDDVLEITVFGAPDLSRTARVSGRGEISLPLLGDVPAAERTASKLASELASRLRQSYMVDPQVSVQIVEIRSRPIYVLGEVNHPGAFPLERGDRITVLQAVALGEGVRSRAAPERAVVIRSTPQGERVGIPINLRHVLEGKAADLPLEPSDIVYVPPSAAKALTYGLVDALLRTATLRVLF
jgi:polysaccharide export outer membrane protein